MPNITMSVIEFFKKLWGDRRAKAIIIIIGIIIFALIIWWIVSALTQKKNDTVYLIDTPLSFSTNHNVDITTDVIKDDKFPSAVNVYPINNVDQVSSIDRFLLSTGRNNLNKTNVQGVYYSWIKNEDVVEYTPNTFQLTFKFSSPLSITSGIGIIAKDNALQYARNLLKNYFGKDYDFINANVINQGNKIRIEFNRSIDGLPLYLSGLDSFSEYLIVDTSGNLYKGSLNLIDLKLSDKENINIVNVTNLSTVMQSDLYPKQVFQGVYPNTIPKPAVKDGDNLDNLNALPQATSSLAKSITLGYFFFDSSYTRLTPVYRIESEGSVVYKSKLYKVPIVIIANALDPRRVYLPK
ncbi:MAG TPA: hypothetical protein VHA74_03950 [Candidatus Dojkabacteria bacterium]|nr:hypothetical protein [Candidatus Dojkabacteria bacterium]